MSETQGEDRSHDPSQKRLQDARQRGDIARTPDLITAAAYGGLLVAALAGGSALRQMAEGGAGLLSQAGELTGHRALPGPVLAAGLGQAMVLPAWPFLVLPALAVLTLLIGQRGLTFSAEALQPKLSRIDPLANLRQKFGPDGLMEFLRALVKLAVTAGVLVLALRDRGAELAAASTLPPQGVIGVMLALVLAVLAVAAGVQLCLGLADALWQRHRYLKRQRMTRKEMLDEARDSDGDPHVKAQRRQKGQEIALNRMLADVPGADVVIVNPTHYAVALRWDRAARLPPLCVAKGTDEVALRIRAAAEAAGVPIRHDPPTARALHAAVQLGAPIRPEHFRAVAAAIRFAEAMRRKAKAWR